MPDEGRLETVWARKGGVRSRGIEWWGSQRRWRADIRNGTFVSPSWEELGRVIIRWVLQRSSVATSCVRRARDTVEVLRGSDLLPLDWQHAGSDILEASNLVLGVHVRT